MSERHFGLLMAFAAVAVACGTSSSGGSTASSTSGGGGSSSASASSSSSSSSSSSGGASSSGGSSGFANGRPGTTYDCDPVTQNCIDGGKCAVAETGSGFASLYCDRDSASMQAEGATCTREQYGYDNCVKGTVCTRTGDQPTLRCRTYCLEDSHCTSSEMCVWNGLTVSDTGTAPRRYGSCAPPCTPFSNECGSTKDCSDVRDKLGGGTYVGCRANGAASTGAACQVSPDCATGNYCNGSICIALCDGAHPCASGTCRPFNGSDGAGECQ